MTAHIGIVGCSAEGAALCYRTICIEGTTILGPHAHPEISMHTPSLADYVACLEQGDMKGVGDLMLVSAQKLARAGADFLICPDNTIHAAFDHVAPRSPLPWLHIADVVAGHAKPRGFKRAAVLGTKWLMARDVYPKALERCGLAWALPEEAERETINRIIMDELVMGTVDPQSRSALQEIIAGLADKGCDCVVLGCTELPLILDDAGSPLPTLDSTRLLARAALKRATG